MRMRIVTERAGAELDSELAYGVKDAPWTSDRPPAGRLAQARVFRRNPVRERITSLWPATGRRSQVCLGLATP
jgi:hypothetical protein